jgi:ATP-dependent RNA helicase HelY
VVADYCNFRALSEGVQVIYTTPLKALSNQKYRDFCSEHGAGLVGLVTGENTVNEGAPILVMTTEILRNVIYDDPGRLEGVRYVVLDEVHYIDDEPRGSVWEEVIVQAPEHIKFVGLSATVGNAQELADWMSENRGTVATVLHPERPVELRLWLGMSGRFYPLFDKAGQINRSTFERAAQDEEASRLVRTYRGLPGNDLLQVIGELDRRDLLPSIYFIFSRKGCREALQRCAHHGLDLTDDREKAEIDAFVSGRLATLVDADEAALFSKLVDASMLRRGLATHHAGLLPYHKELVEELFTAGLIKVVFATETLSLGINMPARAVVVSSFTKFDGIDFKTLTTGELTQLMGRAGRRGIDTLGHGIVLKEADVEIATIYEVAMGEGPVIESKFLPNYNMALNLLRLYTPEQAEQLMARSLGQFQRRVAGHRMEERLENLRRRIADLDLDWGEDGCRPEDVAGYFEIEDRLRGIRAEIRRLNREVVPVRRRGRGQGGYQGRPHGMVGRRLHQLDQEKRNLQDQEHKLRVVRCPNFGEHLAAYGERRTLERDLREGERALADQEGGQARKFRALCRVLADTGFLAGEKPTEKGLLASRVYGENAPVVVEAIWQSLLGGLTASELCSVLALLATEDRGRDRGPRGGPRRYPTAAVAQAAKQVRQLWFHFADLEREQGEQNLRPLAHDYVDFAFRWATGEAMDAIPLPAFVDIGDAIRSMKNLYSLLRQLEYAVRAAEQPLAGVVSEAVRAMERDVIRRT